MIQIIEVWSLIVLLVLTTEYTSWWIVLLKTEASITILDLFMIHELKSKRQKKMVYPL